MVILVELGLLIGGGVLVLLIFRDEIVEVGLGLGELCVAKEGEMEKEYAVGVS